MMAQNGWEADKMLELYIYDYMKKKNWQAAAQSFKDEANVIDCPTAIDAPGGFLFEWWAVFWDRYLARTNEVQSGATAAAAAYIEAQRARAWEQQQQFLQMEQWHFMQQRHALLQSRNLNHSSFDSPIRDAKMYEEPLWHRNSLGFSGNKLHVVQGNHGGVPVRRKQIQAQIPQTRDISSEMAVAQSSLSMNPWSQYGRILQAIPGMGIAGLNQGASCPPLQGCTLTHSAQQSEERCQKQKQLQQNRRKRKQPTTCVAPSTTGTVRQGVDSKNDPHKSLVLYGTNKAGGLASSSNVNNGERDGRDTSALKSSHVEENAESSRDFLFTEIACIRTSNDKVDCCRFSTYGRYLASAGHDKKFVLWDMDDFQTKSSAEEHSLLITDICFNPSSTLLATSSCDSTVRLWNATDPSSSLNTYIGHSSPVTSLDFNQNNPNCLCSCDLAGEIRYWSTHQYSWKYVAKDRSMPGAAKVRFQPRTGQHLAVAGKDMVAIFDSETNSKMLSFQEDKAIRSLCWDKNGNYLATLCEDSVNVWSLASRECIHTLHADESEFYSCVFHPNYCNLMLIGGYKTVEVWDMAESRKKVFEAHEDIIADLAQSAVSGVFASASHDKSVKLWKSEW